MKKTHIIALLVVVIGIGVIISTFSDSSTYANITEAFNNQGEEYHVVGKLNRSEEVIYNPSVNPNLTQFSLIDDEGKTCNVKLYKSKPTDFEKSESVVLIGKAEGNTFHADEILMKCPSKYNEENKIKAAM